MPVLLNRRLLTRQASGSSENKTIIVVIGPGPDLGDFDSCGEVKDAVREAGLSVELHLAKCKDIDHISIEDAYHLGLSPSGSGICIPNGAVLDLGGGGKSVPADHVVWCSDNKPKGTWTARGPGVDGGESETKRAAEECTLDPGERCGLISTDLFDSAVCVIIWQGSRHKGRGFGPCRMENRG